VFVSVPIRFAPSRSVSYVILLVYIYYDEKRVLLDKICK
jgi:hypothetical protein